MVELYESSKLLKYLTEIRQLFRKHEFEFSFVAELIRSCKNDPSIVRELSLIIDKEKFVTMRSGEKLRIWWEVHDNSIIPATNLLLQYVLPSSLVVNIQSNSPLLDCYSELTSILEKKNYTGVLNLNLWNSHDNFDPCDKILAPLGNTR